MMRIVVIMFLLCCASGNAQKDADVLKAILANFYKTEKVVVKGRTQFLFLYCNKANNNEQLFETVNKMKLPTNTIAKIKKEIVGDTTVEDWNTDLASVYSSGNTQLKSKINDCYSLEQYQSEIEKRGVNNQRLMIISKPIFYDANHAIVKVVFYRTIEHNNGSVVHLEKINNQWIIKEHLDPWST